MLLRARIVLPVRRPPVQDGGILVAGRRIAAVGPWAEISRQSSGPSFDLGEVVVLPGLVNSHCHLDYTGMSGLPAQRQFPDWIKGLLALKAACSYTEYAGSWIAGAKMLLRTGTTTVADIEAVPELLPEVWSSTPLRVASFLEMTGVRSRRSGAEILEETAVKLKSLQHPRHWAGLSPHALYSTPVDLLRVTAAFASKNGLRVTMHVAESVEEFDMYRHARGSLFEWLKSQREVSDCGSGTPVAIVQRHGLLGPNFLAVHANCLEPADVAALGASGCSVAHCPRSHAYFRHPPFPFEQLSAAGVNICLGTDSLASTAGRPGEVKLDMFAEMRQFASTNPGVPRETILRMATICGARALGMEGQIGELSENALADMIAVRFTGKTEEAAAAVVHHDAPVATVMIDGSWITLA